MSNARVSQVVAETAGTPTAAPRVSQLVVEAAGTPITWPRVSQFVIEVAGTPFPPDQAVGAAVMPGMAALGAAAVSTIATFTLRLQQATTEECAVAWTTVSRTAVAGTDFVGASGTITFAPDVTTATLAVTVLADPTANVDKSFLVALSGPVNCQLPNPPQGNCVISTLTLGG